MTSYKSSGRTLELIDELILYVTHLKYKDQLVIMLLWEVVIT